MNPRSLPEWIGKSPDEEPPPRVRVRVFDRNGGKCGICGRKIRPGDAWVLEHVRALINGGTNSEDNLGVTCSVCLPEKNADDVAEKSKTYRMRAKHLGLSLRRKRQWR